VGVRNDHEIEEADLIVCTNPRCQTSAGCQCSQPWHTPTNVGNYELRERIERLERIVRQLCPDKLHEV